jgi:hypothetical protein
MKGSTMPHDHTFRLDRAREKETQINDLVQKRSAVEVLLKRLQTDMLVLGPRSPDADVQATADALLSAAEATNALGFGNRLVSLEPGDNDARAEAVEILRLALSRANRQQIVERLRTVNQHGLESYSLAVDQWLRRKLFPEVFSGLFEDKWTDLEARCRNMVGAFPLLRANGSEEHSFRLVRELWERAEWAGGIEDLPPPMPEVRDVSTALRAIQLLLKWVRQHRSSGESRHYADDLNALLSEDDALEGEQRSRAEVCQHEAEKEERVAVALKELTEAVEALHRDLNEDLGGLRNHEPNWDAHVSRIARALVAACNTWRQEGHSGSLFDQDPPAEWSPQQKYALRVFQEVMHGKDEKWAREHLQKAADKKKRELWRWFRDLPPRFLKISPFDGTVATSHPPVVTVKEETPRTAEPETPAVSNAQAEKGEGVRQADCGVASMSPGQLTDATGLKKDGIDVRGAPGMTDNESPHDGDKPQSDIGATAEYEAARQELDRVASTACRDLTEFKRWCDQAISCLETHVQRFGNGDWLANSTPAQRLAREAAKRVHDLRLGSEFLDAVGVQLPSSTSVMQAHTAKCSLLKLSELCAKRQATGGGETHVGGKPPMVEVLESAGGDRKRERTGSPTARLRSWTQSDLDDAIRKYKAERASIYADLVEGVRKKRPGAIKSARKVFGRNAIARALGVKARAMVTYSEEWQSIAHELRLAPAKANRKPPTASDRIGLDIAVEQQAEAEGDQTSLEVIHKETIRLARQWLPEEAANSLVDSLERGEITDDQARETIELYSEQQKDNRTRKVPSQA